MITVEFGSRKRGDFNMSSDRDMLLIGTNFEELLKEKEKRKYLGDSVTCMTESKAKYMVGHGNLFFKHIIDEGHLVEGNEKNYLRIIKGWKAAPNYQKDIDGNVELFEVLSYLPKTAKGLLTAIDIATISIRNILIRKLAALGLYVFSWEQVSSLAVNLDFIDLKEKTILLHARQVKNYYRQGYDIKISIFFLEGLLEILGKILGEKISYLFANKQEVIYHRQSRWLELWTAQSG